MDTNQEIELIQEILDGNADKFRVIADGYGEQLFRVAMGYMHSGEEAEDIVQESLIKAYNSLGSFKGESRLSTWLYRITVNTCINELEKRKRRWLFGSGGAKNEEITEIFGSSSQGSPEQQLIDKETTIKVRKAIDNLPQKQKSAFILQRYQDLSQQEIAQIMDTTEGAVEQLLQRAKSNLKKALSLQ